MAKSETILTEDQWTRDWRAAQVTPSRPKGYMTTRELCRLWGVSEETATKRLRRLQEDGLLDAMARVTITTLDGRQQIVPAYRLKGSKS